MGVYITRLLWVLLLSYFAPLWTLYILQGIVSIIILGFFCLWAYIEEVSSDDPYSAHRDFALRGSSVFGANLIATSIDLFTQANIYWIALAQLLCMVLFGYIGHRVQKHFGIALSCDEPMFKDVPCKSHI